MAANYQCTRCGTDYNYVPPQCQICATTGHVIYTGNLDRKRRESAEAKGTSGSTGAPSTKPKTPRDKPTEKTDWSWLAGIIGFIAGAGYAGANMDIEPGGAIVLGLIAAAIVGSFYKQIIALGIVGFIILLIMSEQQ